MPTTITPSSPFAVTTSISVPADGDIANAASVNGAFTALQTDASGFRVLTYGGGLRRRVSLTSNTVLTIQPLGAIVVKVSSVWTALAHTVASTIDPSALVALAASTRYYVYAAIVAGAIDFTVSTVAPDAGLRYKSGDEQYQFITTFYTNAASDILTYTQTDNYYEYEVRTSTGAADGNMILYAGTATVVTSVSFAAPIPSFATAVSFLHMATSTVGTDWSHAGRSLPTVPESGLISLNTQNPPSGYYVETTQTTNTKYYNGAASTETYIWVTGFWT